MMKKGRPEIEFDLKEVERHGRVGSTYQEMADDFNCTTRTIDRRMAEDPRDEVAGLFCRAFKKGQAVLKRSLRAKQVEAALGGNTTMQIWLGKNMLGQSDKVETINESTMHGLENLNLGVSKEMEAEIKKIAELTKGLEPPEASAK